MADNSILTVIVIGVCIFAFLAFILAYGQLEGGQWNIIAQGVTKFILIIVVFAVAVYTVAHLIGGR